MFLPRKKNSQGIPSGVFYLVDKIDGKTVWRSTRTDDENQAKQILREAEASRGLLETKRRDIRKVIFERATATSELLVERRTSCETAWKIYLEAPATGDLKPRSLLRVQNCFDVFARFMGARNIPDIESVEFVDAEAFLKELTSLGRSPGTVLIYQRNLHSIWRRIRRPLGLLDNPFEDAYIPPMIRQKRRPFTDMEQLAIFTELRRLATAAPTEELKGYYEEWFGVCLLSLWTGLRFGDCVCSDCADINLVTRWIDNNNRKLERYERRVSVPLKDGGDLITYLRWRIGNRISGRLFPQLAERYEQGDSYISKWFGHLLTRLAIGSTKDGSVCFHCWRHTNNTRMADKDADKSTRMELLGQTTERVNDIYNHSTLAKVRAVNSLDFPSVVGLIPQELHL